MAVCLLPSHALGRLRGRRVRRVQSRTFKQTWAVWVFGFAAVLFNPIVPFHIKRDTWQVLDLLAAGLFVAAIAALHKPAPPDTDAAKDDATDN